MGFLEPSTNLSKTDDINLTLEGFDFCLTIRPGVCLIPVDVPRFHESFGSELRPHLEHAFQSAPPNCAIRALIICNPNNPLGQCYSRAALHECLSFCAARNLHFVSDEIYALSVYSSVDDRVLPPFISALSLDLQETGLGMEKVHTVWSFSKDFGCSGLRLVSLHLNPFHTTETPGAHSS